MVFVCFIPNCVLYPRWCSCVSSPIVCSIPNGVRVFHPQLCALSPMVFVCFIPNCFIPDGVRVFIPNCVLYPQCCPFVGITLRQQDLKTYKVTDRAAPVHVCMLNALGGSMHLCAYALVQLPHLRGLLSTQLTHTMAMRWCVVFWCPSHLVSAQLVQRGACLCRGHAHPACSCVHLQPL